MSRGPDEQRRSACYDDTRFISTNRADIKAAIAICGTCTFRQCRPVLAQIRQSPTDSQFVEGVWDGSYHSANTTGRKADRDDSVCDQCKALATETCRSKTGKIRTPHAERTIPRLCPCGAVAPLRRTYCEDCYGKRRAESNRKSKEVQNRKRAARNAGGAA